MQASLPMYDLPPLRPHTRTWWDVVRAELAARGIEAAPDLARGFGHRYAHWTDPALLLSQTCGYPLLYQLGARVQLVATPVYAVPGCNGPLYSSVVLVRESAAVERFEDLRGAVVAFNSADSQSGYNVLRHMAAPLAEAGRFFGALVETGRHQASAERVAAGDADVCALDCVTWALGCRTGVAPAGLRVLTYSPRAPALPYITAAATPGATVAALREALRAAVANPASADAREHLALAGFEVLGRDAYEPIAGMVDDARRAGYPLLA